MGIEIENTQDWELDLNEEVKKQEVYSFLNKESLVGKVTKATIKGVSKSQYKQFLLALDISGKELRTHINKTQTNFLVDVFGPKPANWIGKQVYITGDKGTYNIEGNIKEGVSLTFSV